MRRVSVNPLVHEHISASTLPNVKTYKYSGVDRSVLSNYVMCHYWNFMVQLLPMWLAPNVVTLIGFLISTSSTLLLLFFDNIDAYFYSGTLRGGVPPGDFPPWVWYYAAFSLFAYQTLDAIDGKQARRTKSGSPMGELFDHGCDAFFTPLLQVNICMAMNLDAAHRFFFCVVLTSGLLFAIWEQYVTGTLDFGYITGPTEGILVTCAVFVYTGMYGTGMWWSTRLPYDVVFDSAMWVAPVQVWGVTLRVVIDSVGTALMWFVVASATATIVTNVAHVLVRPSVHKSKLVPLTSLLPNAVVLALFVAYYSAFPKIVHEAPYLLELCFGFMSSYTATRLTVARLCAMTYRILSVFFCSTLLVIGAPLVLVAAQRHGFATTVDLATPEAVHFLSGTLYVLLSIGVLQYAHLIVSVFRQLSQYLKLDVFKIKKQA